jgi:hypothetical protein
MSTILATWEAKNKRIEVEGQPWQIVDEKLFSKITRVKWNGGVAQAIKGLLCKDEAPSSNLSLTKTFNP